MMQRLSSGSISLLALLFWALQGVTVASPAPEQLSPYEWTGVERVVAVGDLHGSYDKAIRLFKAAGLIGDDLHWIGGEQHVVITGDVVDRGPRDRQLMDLVRHLEPEAEAAGGRLHMLLGNHEAMNLMRDLRYVNPESYQAFAGDEKKADRKEALRSWLDSRPPNTNKEMATKEFEEKYPPGYFARQQSLNPDGEYGQWLLGLPAVVKINDVLYMHGGLTEETAELGLEEINRRLHHDLRGHVESREILVEKGVIEPWMEFPEILWVRNQGEAKIDQLPPDVRQALEGLVGTSDSLMLGAQGPLWYRGGSHEDERIERESLERSLELMGARAVVVAHSPTRSREITSRFQNRLFRIDHDISSSDALQALVVEGDDILVLDASTGREIEAPSELPIGRLDSMSGAEWSDGELEAFLGQAQVVASRDLGRGSTRPRLLEMELDGKTQRAIFKTVEIGGGPGSEEPMDRYEHEVAAYQLDRMLGLNLVPVSVIRDLDGEQGSVQAWVEDAVDQQSAAVYELGFFDSDWAKERITEGVVFDALIGNHDRGSADILSLVNANKLFLIDHSKAFPTSPEIDWDESRTVTIDPGLIAALEKLDKNSLERDLGSLISPRQIDALLARRDELLAHVTPKASAAGP